MVTPKWKPIITRRRITKIIFHVIKTQSFNTTHFKSICKFNCTNLIEFYIFVLFMITFAYIQDETRQEIKLLSSIHINNRIWKAFLATLFIFSSALDASSCREMQHVENGYYIGSVMWEKISWVNIKKLLLLCLRRFK